MRTTTTTTTIITIAEASLKDNAALKIALTRHINLVQVQRRMKLRQHRARFALFLKILKQRLEQSREEKILSELRRIVKFYSQRRNRPTRDHNSEFSCSLIDCMEKPIRAMVGEHQWIRAHFIMLYHISYRQR
jgi:hypothetical protein